MSEPEIDVSAVELEVLSAPIVAPPKPPPTTPAGILGARIVALLETLGPESPGVAFHIPAHMMAGHLRAAIAKPLEQKRPGFTITMSAAHDGRYVARVVRKMAGGK